MHVSYNEYILVNCLWGYPPLPRQHSLWTAPNECRHASLQKNVCLKIAHVNTFYLSLVLLLISNLTYELHLHQFLGTCLHQ